MTGDGRRLSAGQLIGAWTLRSELGKGGNGVVWLADKPGSGQAAIKILLSGARERVGRFRNEVQFLIDHPERSGIVPIVDHDLTGTRMWYAMPLAVKLRDALGLAPRPELVLEAVRDIATTLAGLAAENVWHRDLKPDNLFKLHDVWSVGDFGLVKYPNSEALTAPGRKVGPADYMAPEMRQDADRADAELADVFALAKTLWVLLTNQNLPLPGPHRADEDYVRLTKVLDWDLAPFVDLLLERCTAYDPAKRPRMAAVAAELRALSTDDHDQPVSDDTTDLENRIRVRTEHLRRSDRDREAGLERAAAAHYQLQEVLIGFAQLVALKIDFSMAHGAASQRPNIPELVHLPDNGSIPYSTGALLHSPGDRRVWISIGHVLRVNPATGQAQVAAVIDVHRLNNHAGHQQTIYKHISEAATGSALFDQTVTTIGTELAASIPRLLESVDAALQAECT